VTAALAAVDAETVTVPKLYGILASLLVNVGERWSTGEVAVWEEHLASSTVRTIVESLYPRVRALADARGADRGTLLLACPPHEAHDLGLRMLADRLELAGWRVFFLGADTPGVDIVDAARAVGAQSVILSLSTHFHRVAFRSLLAQLREALPNTRILVGGPALARETKGIPDADLFDAAGLLGPGE
jgi:methanogenic corrinoid protein MtbC1